MFQLCHLSKKGPVEGDGEEAVDRPHGNVQVHQKPFLLQSVDCSSDPLEAETSVHAGFRHRSANLWCQRTPSQSQPTLTAMMTPLGTCLIFSTTPYAPRPSSSIFSKSSAFTSKFWKAKDLFQPRKQKYIYIYMYAKPWQTLPDLQL